MANADLPWKEHDKLPHGEQAPRRNNISISAATLTEKLVQSCCRRSWLLLLLNTAAAISKGIKGARGYQPLHPSKEGTAVGAQGSS